MKKKIGNHIFPSGKFYKEYKNFQEMNLTQKVQPNNNLQLYIKLTAKNILKKPKPLLYHPEENRIDSFYQINLRQINSYTIIIKKTFQLTKMEQNQQIQKAIIFTQQANKVEYSIKQHANCNLNNIQLKCNIQKLKKKRKMKRKVRRISSEEIQLFQNNKSNIKKEINWNSRFMMQSIPKTIKNDIKKKNSHLNSLIYPPIFGFSQKKLNSVNITKSQSVFINNRSSKLFNIRLERNKNQTKSSCYRDKTKEFDIKALTEVKQKTENILKKQIEQLYQDYKFEKCHKLILIEMSTRIKNKVIRRYVEDQIKKIKLGKAYICRATKAIKEREKQILCLKNERGNMCRENVINYRQSTLRCIEQILLWREQIESIYKYLQSQQQIKIVFRSGDLNYLATIGRDFCFYQQNQLTKGKFNDPFLICLYQQTDKSKLLKIRACQLLILESQLKEQQ